MKNAANTSIVLWGGRLLALFEAAQPTAMDPTTLQTLGPDLLGGTVKPGASFHFGKVANRLSGEPPGCLSLQQGCFLSLLVCLGACSKPIQKHVSYKYSFNEILCVLLLSFVFGLHACTV